MTSPAPALITLDDYERVLISRALSMAVSIDPRVKTVPSTKGTL